MSDNLPHDKDSTASVTESENPAIPSPTPQTVSYTHLTLPTKA